MSRLLPTVRTMLLLGALASLSGCMFTGNEQLDEVRSDPSPNLDTLHQRPVDVDNAMVVTFDENGRMFWEDLGRVWLTDRPSRLSREPQLRP
ncbi:MAG TPA: hypothetical protein PKE29_06740 [Phycisphaerales bacterium]|nr:hypothetical protein [Phycisphaerales bacterium]